MMRGAGGECDIAIQQRTSAHARDVRLRTFFSLWSRSITRDQELFFLYRVTDQINPFF